VKTNALIARKLIITKKMAGPIICRHQDIKISIAVKVTTGEPPGNLRTPKLSSSPKSYVGKTAVPGI